LCEAYYHYITGILHLAKLEARLAINSVILLTILFFVLLALAFSFWISILVVGFCYLIALHFSLLSAALLISASNLFLICLTIFIMHRAKKNLYFTATRKHILASLQQKEKDDEPAEITNQAN
jgi:hypothetical protein